MSPDLHDRGKWRECEGRRARRSWLVWGTRAPSPDCAQGDQLLTIHKGDSSHLQVLHLGVFAMNKQETERRHTAQAGKD